MSALNGTYISSGKVSLEFRSFAIHPQDIPLTVLARCGGDDTFFGLIEQVYTNFDALNSQTKEQYDQASAAMKLPAAQRYPPLPMRLAIPLSSPRAACPKRSSASAWPTCPAPRPSPRLPKRSAPRASVRPRPCSSTTTRSKAPSGRMSKPL
jgi:hypothetical protein